MISLLIRFIDSISSRLHVGAEIVGLLGIVVYNFLPELLSASVNMRHVSQQNHNGNVVQTHQS